MKLKDLVNLIINTAKTQPCINTALEGDVYQLNERKDVKYGAFVLTLGDVVKSEDWRTCNFTMFYVDRRTEDESNRLDVQTTALDCLGNIATTLENFDLELQSVSYHPFTNRFESECAGAYAELAVAISNEECADIYDIITPEPYDPFNPYVILEDYAKKSWVNNNFDTSEEVDGKIKEAVIEAGAVTPEIVDDKIAEALENYPDSAQTQEIVVDKIADVLEDYPNFSQTQFLIEEGIENQHLKTINGNSIKGDGNIEINGVMSDYVNNIWVGTMEQYQEIYPKSEVTLYIITDN